jgi:hypothetical protein
MPIGLAWHTTFEPSGDLLTNGSLGVWRWPVQVSTDRTEYHIGPPQQVPLPGSDCTIDHDTSGQIIALANYSEAYVITPGRQLRVGTLDDCRYVAVSPDGEWLATGMHRSGGAQVWRIRDGMKVKKLPIGYGTLVLFSPDGKWLLTGSSPCRLWSVGAWEEARQIGGQGRCFSPDGHQLLVQDADMTIRLVETETGRTLARFESPDLCTVASATFSPDGTRLVVSTNDGPCVHIWDLRAIRKHLAEMGLDWDAPAFAETEPATENTPATPLKIVVDMGDSGGELRSLLDRALELERAGKIGEAIGMLREASRQWPDASLGHNNLAWLLATGPQPLRNPTEALEHARHAVRLAPGEQVSLNTLGVALYRAGKFAEAITTLQKSVAAGKGQFDAFDLFFLAMAHQRPGHRAEARECFYRAVRWMGEQKTLPAQYAKELAEFRAEAEAAMSGPPGDLPVDVFAPG